MGSSLLGYIVKFSMSGILGGKKFFLTVDSLIELMLE